MRTQKITSHRSLLLVVAIIELAIAYGFASLAIDRGNLWWYLLTLIFFVQCLRTVVRLFKRAK